MLEDLKIFFYSCISFMFSLYLLHLFCMHFILYIGLYFYLYACYICNVLHAILFTIYLLSIYQFFICHFIFILLFIFMLFSLIISRLCFLPFQPSEESRSAPGRNKRAATVANAAGKPILKV